MDNRSGPAGRAGPATSEICQRCGRAGAGCGAQLPGLYAYWDAKRAGRAFPARADIDPLELAPWLANIFLVEIDAAQKRGAARFRYRLSGTAVDEIHGQTLTGKTPADIKTPEVARIVERQYAEVFASRQPRCDRLTMVSDDGRYWSYERLILPLSSDGATPDMFLCGIYRLEQQWPQP